MKVLWARKFATVAEEKLYAKQIVCGGRVTAGHGHKGLVGLLLIIRI
jgi:hypothetical protein